MGPGLVGTLVLPVAGRLQRLADTLAANVLPGIVVYYLSVCLSLLTTLARLGAGTVASERRRDGDAPGLVTLYEYVDCPFCTRVRAAASSLALDVLFYPCPRVTVKRYGVTKGSRFRGEALKLGKKAQFPFCVAEDGAVAMYESEAIMRYLYERFGAASADMPWALRSGKPQTLLLMLSAVLFRPMFLKCPSKCPEKPFTFVTFEGHPTGRLVQERLSALELPYLVHYAPLGGLSPYNDQRGLFTDPNTGFRSRNARDIMTYLESTYKTGPWNPETLADYSTAGASSTHGKLE